MRNAGNIRGVVLSAWVILAQADGKGAGPRGTTYPDTALNVVGERGPRPERAVLPQWMGF